MLHISVIFLVFLPQDYWYRTKSYTEQQTCLSTINYMDWVSADSRPIYIEWLSSDYQASVDEPLTECRPITGQYIGQVSTNYWQNIGEVAVKYHWTKSYISWHTSWSIYHRLSNGYLPSLDGYINQCSGQYISWYYLQ